jgi:hypothetical protein
MKTKLLIYFAILGLSLPARGQDNGGWSVTSLKLREYCKFAGLDQTKLSNQEYDHSIVCLFYVSGVLDGFQIGGSATKLCVPDGASLGQLALIVSKYLDQHPEMLHNPPQYLVIDALRTAFPCGPAPPKK